MLKIARLLLLLSLAACLPRSSWACACGCGVFEVGTSSMFSTQPGGVFFAEYDHANQNRNWSGASPASADDNEDKKLLTDYYTIGGQYMFDRTWGFGGDLPYVGRFFKTTDEDGNVAGFDHSAVGDIRVYGIYTGLASNMSTGLTFGLKLPTGDYTYPHFDPDSSIGSGSTDLLLGAYHMAEIRGSNWNWFAHAEGDQPLVHAGGYRPGTELNASAGSYYDGWKIGPFKIAPIAQLVGTHRWSDSGTLSNAPNSGYSRLLLTPGLELKISRFTLYVDVGFPIYQDVTGNQIVASEFFKINVSHHFSL